MTTRSRRILPCLMLALCFGNAALALEGSAVDEKKLRNLLVQAGEQSPNFREIQSTVISSKAFSEVWNGADRYAPLSLSLFSDQHFPNEQKRILALGIQNAGFRKMLGIWKSSFELWEKGKITSDLLDTILFPGYDWSVKLQENYQNKDARVLLEKVRSSNLYQGNPNRSKYVEDVISGRAARDVEQLRKDGQLLKRSK